MILTRERLKRRLPSMVFWVVVFFLVASSAVGQSYKIADIRVVGNIHASEKMIRDVAAMKIGSELTGTMIQDAIKSLYAKGMFRDIQVDAENVSSGIVVTFRVSEYPQLSGITFKGNKKISEKDLREKLGLAPGGFISDYLKIEAKNKIERAYVEKGYFLAEAIPDLQYAPDSANALLEFNIKEREKVKVEKVYLTGSHELKAKDIVNKMSNRKHGFLRSSDFKKEKYPEDKDKIIAYCRKKGYVDAYIKSDSFVIDTARNRMRIYIDIFEGPRYYFGEPTFVDNTVYTDEKLRNALKFSPGEVFNQEKYDESIAELYGAYQEEGYLHTRFLDTRHTHDSLIDIEYNIIEGLPSEVRLIEISGNTKTKEKVIRRELFIRPGQTFHRSLMMRSLRQVMQLNYFGDVRPDIRTLPSGDVDVLLEVEEKPTGQVSAGAGYSGQDKLVGTFGLGIPNFRGNGQNVSINVDFGSRRNSVSFSFTEPWFLSTPTSVGFDLYSVNRNWYSDFTEGRRGGSVRVGRRLRWPDDYFKAFVSYRIEDVRYHDFSDNYLAANGMTIYHPDGTNEYQPDENSLVSFGEDWLRTSAVTLTIERDSRDLPMFSTNGARVGYSIETSGYIFGGDWEYVKHTFFAHRYFPLGWNFSLAAKGKFGYISAKDNNLIPYSERFSPGGTDPDGMVRGYEDASLTERTRGGAYLRGISEVVYNLELQFPVVEQQLYLLAFADAGTSWLSRDDIRPFSHLFKGAGLGFRFVVAGIGVIGFDFGYAFDKSYGNGTGWRPHFQVGPGY